MHRVGQDGVISLGLGKHHISKGDTVIFVFGEIDVRCHILKQRDAGRELSEIIETLASRYVEAINHFRRKIGNLSCLVQLIVPPTDRAFDSEYPYYGSIEERVGINRMLNESLKSHCENSRIGVLDFTDNLSAQNGQLIPEMSDGTVHCGKIAFPFVEKALLANISDRERVRVVLSQMIERTGVFVLYFILRRLIKTVYLIVRKCSAPHVADPSK